MTHILIIEEDSHSYEAMHRALHNQYEILTAHRGSHGIELATQYQPALVICGIESADMDGFQILQHMRQNNSTQSIAFIFVTENQDYSNLRRAMSLGADDYIITPFDDDDFRAAIEAQLQKKALRDAQYHQLVDEMRQNITTSLPHELRTALMIVEGYIHLIMEDAANLSEDSYAMLLAIKQYAQRLHQLAEKFYWYSITELISEAIVTMEPCPHPALLIEEIAHKQAHKAARLDDLQMNLTNATICMAEDYFRQVIGELIENAFKFSNNGHAIQIKSSIKQDSFILKIHDQGRGIATEHLGKINGFMQFERARYEQQGMGLGLVIARRLTQLAGGTFWVESEIGTGTQITLTLPLAP